MIGRQARTIDGVEYAPGRKFRVLVWGQRLNGWVAIRGGSRGWTEPLEPGDVIECTGFGPGMGSDPGYGIEFTSEAAKEAGAFHADLAPQAGGMWNYHPVPGALEPIEDEES